MNATQKKTYVTPILSAHGSIVETTLGGPEAPPYEFQVSQKLTEY